MDFIIGAKNKIIFINMKNEARRHFFYAFPFISSATVSEPILHVYRQAFGMGSFL